MLARPGRVQSALIVAAGLYLGVNLLLPALRAWCLGLPAIDSGHLLWTAGVPLALICAAGILPAKTRLLRWMAGNRSA